MGFKLEQKIDFFTGPSWTHPSLPWAQRLALVLLGQQQVVGNPYYPITLPYTIWLPYIWLPYHSDIFLPWRIEMWKHNTLDLLLLSKSCIDWHLGKISSDAHVAMTLGASEGYSTGSVLLIFISSIF
jgi:hypothetical protein